MRFKEIASRITGFSTALFGVSWNPSEAEVAVARRIVAFLEDRRVLFNAYHLEVEHQCIKSVLDIRRFLTDEIGRLPNESQLTPHIRAMRAACRVFLDRAQDGRHRHYGGPYGSEFFTALGELRAAFGIRIAAIAVMYGLDVEGQLADTLPPLDSE